MSRITFDIDIDDDLFEAATQRAAERGLTWDEYVEDVLSRRLAVDESHATTDEI